MKKNFKFLNEATYANTVVDTDTVVDTPTMGNSNFQQEIFKVFYQFVIDLLSGKLQQFENYKRKLTKNELLELVKTGELKNYNPSYGKATALLNNLDKITRVKFQEVNEFNDKINLILTAAKDVVPLLKSDDKNVRNQALILLNKAKENYETLENLLLNKQVDLSKKMPQSFNIKDAKEMLRIDLLSKRTGTKKVQISQVMNRPGLILSALNELVKNGTYTTLEVLPAVNYLKKEIKNVSKK